MSIIIVVITILGWTGVEWAQEWNRKEAEKAEGCFLSGCMIFLGTVAAFVIVFLFIIGLLIGR